MAGTTTRLLAPSPSAAAITPEPQDSIRDASVATPGPWPRIAGGDAAKNLCLTWENGRVGRGNEHKGMCQDGGAGPGIGSPLQQRSPPL